jgi:hypothetical protein
VQAIATHPFSDFVLLLRVFVSVLTSGWFLRKANGSATVNPSYASLHVTDCHAR